MGQSPEIFTGRILFMSMFNDISCDRKGNKEECLANARVVKELAKRFGVGQWSFFGPGSEKKWYSAENSPQGAWDHIADEMLLEFAESGHPTFRATTPLSRGKLVCKGKGKVSIHFSADQDTVDTIYRFILSVNQLSIYGAVAAICDEYEGHQDGTEQPVILVGQSIVLGEIKAEVPDKENCQYTSLQIIQQLKQFFRIIISANQLSIYGAVATVCEEFETHQDGSGEPDVLMGQSIVLGEIKADIALQNENSSNHQILWQQYMERIESLSPESKVSRFCMEAGFMRVVEVGQYFITKDTGDYREFRSVACREYTLHRNDPASQPKGRIQGNMRIRLVLEVTTRYQYGKHGIEIRIWSVGQDNSQSWVRISYGTNKYVIDSNHNNTDIPADPHEDQTSQTSVKVIAARSKAKAKPQKRELVDTPSIIPMHERK